MKLAQALPEFADELSQGLSDLGYKKLAATVDAVEIVERCRCDEPGCVTFYAVPKKSAPSGEKCNRVIAPAKGVVCVQYIRHRIIWVEVLGRPEDRERLDRLENQRAECRQPDPVSDTSQRTGRFRSGELSFRVPRIDDDCPREGSRE